MIAPLVALHLAGLLLLPPFLPGVIGKTKAWFAGRQGPPLLQPWSDVRKLWGKGAVYSRTTTWVFRAGPIVTLGATLTAGLVVPIVADHAPLSFGGDLVLFAYLFGLGRFATVLAALDTGSSFEGMGASREVAFSALAEAVLFLVLMTLAIETESVSFAGAFEALALQPWLRHGSALALAALALLAVVLVENSRVPVDDPATHLELTMIHEVMVLDHGGPDFAIVLYGSAVKLFVLSAVTVRLVAPIGSLSPAATLAAVAAGVVGVAVLIGTVESVMARLRLLRVPQFIIAGGVLAGAGLAILLTSGS